jgi:NADH:ubiquinone oxidoreductase subunit 2 (subunit N)
MILILNNFINLTSIFFNTNGFTLVFLNVFVYIFLLLLIFGLFFIFDLRSIRTLNELKFFGGLSFISINIAIILLSMAGLPPLFGFMSKFLFFIFFLKAYN